MSKIKYIPPKRENTSPINRLPLVAGVTDNKATQNLVSGKPCRYPLAFFVSKFWLAPQATQSQDTTHLTHFTGLNRHIYAHSVTSYGGVTLQNSPLWVICRAVANKTESEPRYPMTSHSVVSTHNLLGVA